MTAMRRVASPLVSFVARAACKGRCSLLWRVGPERRREFLSIETKGTCLCFEANVSRFIDQVETIRPAGIFLLHAIAYRIDEGWNRDMEVAHTRVGHFLAIFFRGWIGKQNTFLDVALHLPNIARMRLIDVNNEERYSIFVLLIQLVERGNLPAKGRSSVTAEDENNRFPAAK